MKTAYDSIVPEMLQKAAAREVRNVRLMREHDSFDNNDWALNVIVREETTRRP